MALDKRGAAAPTFDDDKTTVDFTANDRARRDFVSVHDVPRTSEDDFDDLPTTIAPAPWAASGDVPTGVRSTRRLRSVEQEQRALAPLPVPRAGWDDEVVTRIAPPPVLPLPFAGAVAAVGGAKKPVPARSPVLLASVVVLTVLAAMLTFGWLRQHERAQSPVAATPPTTAAHAAPPRPATKPAAVVASTPATNPTPAAPPPPAAPLATTTSAPPASPAPPPTGSPDERTAVEAVQSGDLARAARLYTALSASHPTNDAYREAARILSEGTKESHP
ncbi:MAG TPA: hypothetical protein VGI39_23165 [Polyangiaceae bacterium]|jgi:hypothetical protein